MSPQPLYSTLEILENAKMRILRGWDIPDALAQASPSSVEALLGAFKVLHKVTGHPEGKSLRGWERGKPPAVVLEAFEQAIEAVRSRDLH